jgi:hypothetical protein
MKPKPIRTYTSRQLHGYRPIMESNGDIDLVEYERKKKCNFDYDWKRHLDGISPVTKPHQTMVDMLKYRRIMQRIRKHGFEATPQEVQRQMVLSTNAARNTGGPPVAAVRMLLRGILQGHIHTTVVQYDDLLKHIEAVWTELRYTELYSKKWSKADCSNAKRGQWVPGAMQLDTHSVDVITLLVPRLGGDPEAVRQLLFEVSAFSHANEPLIALVVRSLAALPSLNRAILNKEPFRTLYLDGRIPDNARLLFAFPSISEEILATYSTQPVTPGGWPAYDRAPLRHLFKLAGVPPQHCDECAKVLITPVDYTKLSRRNPSWKSCRDAFVHALFQPGMNSREIDAADIYQQFQSLDITRRKIRELKNNHRFSRHPLRNTHANSQQIQQMAKLLRYDPAPYISLLIEPGGVAQ